MEAYSGEGGPALRGTAFLDRFLVIRLLSSLLAKSGAARTITSDGKEPLDRKRMSQPESRAIYARRKTIVEPVFGQIKNSGFRGFGLRGKAKVAGEFSLVCVAHNLKKIMLAAKVCPFSSDGS